MGETGRIECETRRAADGANKRSARAGTCADAEPTRETHLGAVSEGEALADGELVAGALGRDRAQSQSVRRFSGPPIGAAHTQLLTVSLPRLPRVYIARQLRVWHAHGAMPRGVQHKELLAGAWRRVEGAQRLGAAAAASERVGRALTRLPRANLAPSSLVMNTVTRSLSLAWEPRAT